MNNSVFTTKHRNMTSGWLGVPLFELSRQIILSKHNTNGVLPRFWFSGDWYLNKFEI